VSIDTHNEVGEAQTNHDRSTMDTLPNPDVQQSPDGTSSVPYNTVGRGTSGLEITGMATRHSRSQTPLPPSLQQEGFPWSQQDSTTKDVTFNASLHPKQNGMY
jgi:hypothetical protein